MKKILLIILIITAFLSCDLFQPPTSSSTKKKKKKSKVDNIPLQFASGYPIVNQTSSKTYDIKIKANKDGKCYYILLSNEEEAPVNSVVCLYSCISPPSKFNMFSKV